MIGKYNLWEPVKYNEKVYLIVKVLCFDLVHPEYSMVYALMSPEEADKGWPYLLVAEENLTDCSESEKETIRILYGKG